MSDITDVLTPDDAARRLGLEPRRLKQLVRDRALLAAPGGAHKGIMAASIAKGEDGWEPLWNLPGTLTVLSDGGFSDEEALNWLYTPLEELGGQTPIDALIAGRQKKVNAIASGLAF